MIGIFQKKRSPADGALGEHNFEVRVAQQDAREEKICQVEYGAGRTNDRLEGCRELGRQVRRQRKLQLRGRAGVKAQRHTEILAGCPNRIVVGTIDMRQLAQMHWFSGKDDAAMAAADRALDLAD